MTLFLEAWVFFSSSALIWDYLRQCCTSTWRTEKDSLYDRQVRKKPVSDYPLHSHYAPKTLVSIWVLSIFLFESCNVHPLLKVIVSSVVTFQLFLKGSWICCRNQPMDISMNQLNSNPICWISHSPSAFYNDWQRSCYPGCHTEVTQFIPKLKFVWPLVACPTASVLIISCSSQLLHPVHHGWNLILLLWTDEPHDTQNSCPI